jgi:PilZ domain
MPTRAKTMRRMRYEPVDNGLLAALMPSLWKSIGWERRKEVRYPTNDPALVRLSPGKEYVSGTILEISKSGVRIELNSPITAGSRVEIILPGGAVVFGSIRHCKRVADAQHAGVLIEHVVGELPELRELALAQVGEAQA